MDLNLLKKLNMTSREIMLYLKLLEFGMAGASTLAKAVGENRTTTYSLLQSMQAKGQISFFKKGQIKYFSATSPQVLIESFIDDGTRLKQVLPELLSITNKYAQKPRITYYEGIEGIKQISEILLEVPKSVHESFMGIDAKTMHPAIKEYYEADWINRRIEKTIIYRGIVTGSLPFGNKYEKSEKGQLRELKYIDGKKLPLRIHIDIFPTNKVAIYSYNKDEMMGVIIEHETFYSSMRTVFKLAWAGVDVLS